MSDRFDIDVVRLTDYLCGECTPEERTALDQWIATVSERRGLMTQLQIALEIIDLRYSGQVDLATAWRGIATRSGISSSARNVPSTGSARRWIRVAVLGASAALLLAFGTRVHQLGRAPRALHRYQTAPGQRSTIQLADGSSMILAPATSVMVHTDGVDVDGEVYFAIAKRSSHPFTVQTRNALVHVLGTRFVVRQYKNEAQSRVVVEDGKVTLRPLQQHGHDVPPVLSAEMLGQVTDSGITVTSGIATGDYTNWTQGQLVFREVPLRDVLADLARAYGVDIRIADTALALQPMTITAFVQRQPLTEVLDLIGLATKAHYTRVDSAFVIAPGRVASPTPQVPHAPQVRRFPQPEKQNGR